ncbi:MAG: hypothetical protein A2030_10900 [Chloroflexi bacterium RBG_19FT_COMBO_50_10]|nr:MAG: hypothetical protein A2030_10900 [Chloroflexi bacterium RBG_19FT_COMBO_50_10]
MQSGKTGFSRLETLTSTWIWFIITLLAIAIFTSFGPAELSLGTHIRVVYLHGAWVWVSLAAFLAAGVCGGVGLVTKCSAFHCWSGAFGRTGLFFWVTYLPLSLWAMQTNWNGLFLAEPRWRMALVFAISGLLLQVGLSLANKPILTSSLNSGFSIALMVALLNTTNVMHPVSPILNSEAWRIQFFFAGLVLLTLLAAWQMARWWYKRESYCISR